MKAFFLIVLLVGTGAAVFAQKSTDKVPDKPRLVVGIIVDQMRQEYLYRFSGKFGEGGFKRLMNGGYMLKNAHYNYVPTYTGPGHASVYTGSTPAIHGIIANDWYDKASKKNVNCVQDDRQKAVGDGIASGTVSPWRMLTTTITDELKLSTQLRSKVVGVSLKDRGAVLPAGHAPDGAYWFDSRSGHFITSTYYMKELPEWVAKFNAQNPAEKYLAKEWNTLLPLNQYTESGPDDSPYERFADKGKSVFPYNLPELRKQGYDLVTRTPFGDDLLAELAKAALVGEELGKDDITDFLAVSFSSPDIIGHAMGPNSVEVEDTYLRLDRNIQDLLNELDKTVGAGKYTVFLSADHAVAEVPQYLLDNSFPGDYLKGDQLKTELNTYLQKYFAGKNMVEDVSNYQIFLNQEIFNTDPKTGGIDFLVATELISNYLMAKPGVAQVYSQSILRNADYADKGYKGMVVRGYHPKRSGDIAFVLEPGWIDGSSHGNTGTTHGSPYTYDTNVPILFYGFGIKKGATSNYHTSTDIAPTLSVLLKIKFPSGCTGQPIAELLD